MSFPTILDNELNVARQSLEAAARHLEFARQECDQLGREGFARVLRILAGCVRDIEREVERRISIGDGGDLLSNPGEVPDGRPRR